MNTRSFHPRAQRGSLLIVAMIISAVIGISLASYIRLGLASQKISNRALYNNAAMNLAENGMEEAMYSVNQQIVNLAYNWDDDGWTPVGTTDVRREWNSYTFDQNATGRVRVYVYNYDGAANPTIVARSTVTLGGATSAPIEKWIRVQLARTSKFANGLVAKQQIRFSGNNATVDSWNSDPDNDNDPADVVPYSAASKNDEGSVGSIAVSVDAVLVQNADIFGYVATGGSPATVGSNGLVGPFGTTAGTIAPGHSSTDFSASFDAVTPPSGTYTSVGAISGNTTLPGGVAAAADGKYYISATQINFNNKYLNVEAGKIVILKLTDTSTSINVGGGSGVISIGSGATLSIYAEGSIDIGGQGISNGVDGADAGTTIETSEMGQPKQFQIWGTKTSGTQDIKIAGNGALSAVVYAPQGSVKINGNGDVAGSVVANDITVVGNATFHYDESLGNFGGGNPFRVVAWTELTTAAQRSTYSGSAILGW